MMKKVLFIMPALSGGGAEKVLIDILKNIDRSRYDLTLLLEYKEDVYTSSVPDYVKVISLYRKSNIWIERLHRGLGILHCYNLFHSLIYRLAFLWLLRGKTFDTMVSFMEGEAVRIHSYLNHKAKKNVSWIHIDFKKKHWSLGFFRNRRHERNCYSQMDEIVFVSEDARRSFLEIYPCNENTTVLYNLIDRNEIFQLAQTQEIAKDKMTICMVGRLNRQKRYDRALEVMRRLKDDGIEVDLWILGVGELEQQLKSRCEELGISDMIRFWGFVRPPYPHMRAADIYLSTSEAEGYPLVLCEALCLGLPVVATDITGSHEMLDDSKYGLLVKEDVEDIYGGLKKMLEDCEMRKRYKQRAEKRSRMFSVANILSQIDQIL